MSSSPTPAGVPPTPSAVTPGLVVVAGLVACWLTEDPLVLRTAATVATVAALIAVVQLTRNVTSLNTILSAELRTQNREIARLRDAVNDLHEQVGEQRQGVERVRREAVEVRAEAAQVREEAAALLEAADSKVTSLGGGTLASAFTGGATPYSEPLTGPGQAFTEPPRPPARQAPITFGDRERVPSPSAAPPPPPPPPSMPSSSGSEEELGYLEDFSIQGPDDEPLTQSWSSADEETDQGGPSLSWGFADAERGRDKR